MAFFLLLVIFYTEDNCRILQFTSSIDGAVLEKHLIRTITINSEYSCGVQCYLDNLCVSYNFGMRASGEIVCEINNSTHAEHPHDLKQKTNFIYRGTEVQ